MLGEELSFNNILSQEEAETLFTPPESGTEETPPVEKTEEEKEDKTKETIEVSPDTLFETPESVGSDEGDSQEQGDAASKQATSPKSFYSSIAKAMKDDGILSDLADEDLKEVKTAEDFEELMQKHLDSKLDEVQKRVKDALEYGVEPDEVKQYENTINYLNSLTPEAIKDEEQGEKLRMQLIYQDFINNGASPEKAKRLMEASIKAGTDIEDAMEALESNKKHFKSSYDKVIAEAKEEYEQELKERKEAAEKLRKSILDTDEPLEGVKLNKVTKQKVLDTLTKPVYKDDEGVLYTAIQKAEKDDPVGFARKLGVIFTLTNGFKNLSGLTGGQVKQETKKAISNLEKVINNTSRTFDGNLQFMSGVGGDEDPNAYAGLSLDIQ